MPVGDHGVRALHARGEGRRARREAGEETEGAVHVEPRTVLLGEIRKRSDRVELAGVHVAGVPDDDRRRAAEVTKRLLEGRQVDPPDRVAGERLHAAPADPEHRERLRRARVDQAAREHRHRRQTRHAVGADVAPVLLPHHCRAAAKPMKFAVVAPVVSAPPHSAGSAKSSFSQPTDTVRAAWRAASRPS